jgi:DNA-binding transcriptional MerR regulator
MMMNDIRPTPENLNLIMPLEIEIDLSEELESQPVIPAASLSASQAVNQATGLFPVDFAIENLNFVENSFDEIELVSPEQLAAKIQIDQEDLNSIENIPKKMAFKIGEVADMVGVKQYVLRYWESEFDQLNPKKSKYNQRVYTRKDVENALLIKKLLYKDRFSIEGARSALKQLKETVKEERAVRVVHQNQEHAIELVEDLLAHIRKSKLSI